MSLEAVLCTEELFRRPTRVPDYETENRLLRALTQALVDSPRTILQTLAEQILEGLRADSAGVSLLADDSKSFFWPAIAGAWAQHVGGGTPRDFGPCGDVLDRNTPLLFTHVERRYSYFLPIAPPAEECLLVPFYIEGKAVGTIWAIAHDGRRKFDAEDLRQLESLGGFASAAYQAETNTATEQRRAARELAEALEAGQLMEALHAKLLASHEALRRSEGDLRDFVDNAAVGLHWVGSDGSILWANQTELDLLGYTRDEYFGQHIADFHADEPVIADILARLTVGETLHDYEARLRCKDGSIRHVLISSNTLFEHDKFVHTRCFTRDITDRKQAEETLRENEWRLRYAMESARLTYVEVDLTRGEARTADNFAAVMGYPAPPEQEADAAAGTRLLLEHVVPHDRQRVDEALQQFTEGNPIGTVQYRVLGDDRIERWIESRWSVELGPDSQSRKSFATNLDITELKQVEAALRMSEERGRLALDSAELGMFNIDPATNTFESDDRFKAIFGSPTERIDSEQAFATAHPDDRSRVRDAVAAAMRTDDPVPLHTECRVVRSDGTVRWVLAKGRANFVQHGLLRTITSLDGTVADITERKLSEVALRESEAFSRSIVESSPDCIKVLGLDGTLLSLLRGQELLGIEDAEPFLKTSWFELWEGEHRRAAQSAVAEAATGGAGSFVGFFRTFRGEPKWWDVAISPILDASGKPARLLAVSRDVTHRRRGELNLEFLASVSQDLLHLASVDDMLKTVGAKIGAFLDLSICAFAEISETAEEVVIAHDWHRADAMGLVGVYPLTDFVGPEFIRVARSGEIIVVRDTVTDPRTEPTTFAALNIASFICAPLILDGQWRFALCLYRPAAYDWREDEIELAREVTARVWTRLERLRSEDALRESEERYRTLFSSIDEGFCVIELIFNELNQAVDYRFLEVNPTFERQVGLHEAAGQLVSELIPNLEPYWYEIYGRVSQTGEAVRFINEVKGLGRWLDVYACRVGGPDSRKVAVVFNDISERRRSEEALRNSEERYRYLFNSIDEGFCVVEMMFDEQEQPIDYRFLEVNPTFEKQSGLHNAAGKRIRELAPEIEASWFTRYGDVAVTGEPVRFINESKILNSWFDVYAFRVGGQESRRVAIIFNNITERTKSEQALRESAEALADLDRRKDEFLAMLGHELRNPLAPLSYAVHMLGLQANENPLQQQSRQIIERQVSQLKRLVDDLLEISRVTTGRLQLREERIVVSGFVERAVETAQPLITQRRHELTVSLPSRPIWLHADAARMEQVVVNLLTNAAKYTDEGGQIGLTVQQEGDEMVLRVWDTGVGIASEFLPRIFDLFTQAARSLDRSEGGLGIGLCLVKRLVELHAGSVEAHSVLGQGSEFVVRIPSTQATLSVLPLDLVGSALPMAKRCRVLIVDDNVDAAQSLALLLTASGHDVRIAHDGPTAVDAAVEYRPDLALMDIGLPGFDGYEVAQRMRQQSLLEHALLVAMTGYGQEKDRVRSLAAGFDHHLVKPVNFDRVQEILALVSAKVS